MPGPPCTPLPFETSVPCVQKLPQLTAVSNPPTGGTLLQFEGGLVGLSTNSNLITHIPSPFPALEFFIATNSKIIVIMNTQPIISLTLARVHHPTGLRHEETVVYEDDGTYYDSDRVSNGSECDDDWHG